MIGYIQKSKLVLRCAAIDCPNHHTAEFETFDEVVRNQGWELPTGWREVEVQVEDDFKYYVCCPKHDIKLVPNFVSTNSQETPA